jgi:hypothetical protein
LIYTSTTAFGHLEDGPYSGTTVELFFNSSSIDIADRESVDVPRDFNEVHPAVR